LKIFHLIGHLRLGAGRYIVEMASEQKRLFGHETEIIVSHDIDKSWRSDEGQIAQLSRAGISVTTIGNIFKRDTKTLKKTAEKLKLLLESTGEDYIIHAHSAIPAIVAKLAGAEKVVATCHGWNPDRPIEHNIEDARGYAMCDAIITPSRHWAGRLKDELAIQNAVVIPVGVRMENFPPTKRGDHRNKHIKTVTVCELTHRKGVDLLITAMPIIWEKGHKDAELHIFGAGDMEETLKRLARRIDTRGSRIVFHGFVTEPYRQLANYDIFSLASRSDNYPVSIIEAMLACLPVVGSNIGGIPEMIKDGQCGIVVKKESSGDIASAVMRLIEKGKENMLRLGRNGETFAREKLGIEKTVTAIENVYRKVTNKTG